MEYENNVSERFITTPHAFKKIICCGLIIMIVLTTLTVISFN